MNHKIKLVFVDPIEYMQNNPESKLSPEDLDDEDFYLEAKLQETVYPIVDIEEDWDNGSFNVSPNAILRVYPRNRYKRK